MDDAPPEFSSFLRAAEAICATIEQPSTNEERADFCWRLRRQLADLLAAAFRLPDAEPSALELPSSPSSERSAEVFGALQGRFNDLDMYWSNLMTRGDGADGVTAVSLADDLAEIWRDLRTGLEAFGSGSR